MSNDDAGELLVARLRVYDDLADQTFIAGLDDVVRLIDDQKEPGKYRASIIALVNEYLLERYPQLEAARAEELSVGIGEFSDLKIEVIQKLMRRALPIGYVH